MIKSERGNIEKDKLIKYGKTRKSIRSLNIKHIYIYIYLTYYVKMNLYWIKS